MSHPIFTNAVFGSMLTISSADASQAVEMLKQALPAFSSEIDEEWVLDTFLDEDDWREQIANHEFEDNVWFFSGNTDFVVCRFILLDPHNFTVVLALCPQSIVTISNQVGAPASMSIPMSSAEILSQFINHVANCGWPAPSLSIFDSENQMVIS